MSKKLHKVETEHAPKAIGPYSQAVRAGDFLFISGMIPIDPKTDKLVEHTIQAQTRQVLENIGAILKAEGLSFENVVKSEVFLKDMNEFQEMNAVYAEKFSHAVKPARYTVEVARLPKDVKVEISCTAHYG